LVTTSQATTYTIGEVSGPLVYFAGGGGGGAGAHVSGTGAAGGIGGGKQGAGSNGNTGASGSPNSGGGAGGAGYNASPGPANPATGNGGKGVVIIRYAGSQLATGGSIDTSNPGYTTHIFTGDATFSVNSAVAQAYSIN
jgi:hypothetical protein